MTSTSWPPPAHEPPAALRAWAPQAVWADGAARILERHGLPRGVPRMAPCGSDVVMQAGEVFVKITSAQWRAQMANEVEMLCRVEKRLDLATQQVLGTGELDGWPYLATSRVPGEALSSVWEEMDRSERVDVARQIGHLVARLRAIPVPAEAASEWQPFLERMRATVVSRLGRPGVDARWLEQGERWIAERWPFLGGGVAWLHTELVGDHLLVERRTDASKHRFRLSGVIDLADGCAGHPDYELPALAEFLFRGERPLLEELLRASGADPATFGEQRSRALVAWSLLHQFAHLPRLLAACGPEAPATLEQVAERLYPLG